MITRREINSHGYPETQEQQLNIDVLLERMNKLRTAYGKPMIVTSGLRSREDQIRINSHAPNSNHTKGAAVDILDTDGTLKIWVLKNVERLEAIGLWCEDFRYTPNWVHFQIFAPPSQHRFFVP